MKPTTILLGVTLLVILGILGLQVAAKVHGNPAVLGEPQWDSPQTRQLAKRACFDCHSNETNWPWYSSLPGISRQVEQHVLQGRRHLNFSEWVAGRGGEGGGEAAEKVFQPLHYLERNESARPSYQDLHPRARLSPAEQEQLAQGLAASLGRESEGSEGGERGSSRARGNDD